MACRNVVNDVRQRGWEAMFGKESTRDTGLEFQSGSSNGDYPLAHRRAVFHRRHLLAAMRDWALALLLVSLSLWLAALAVFTVLH